MVKKLEPDHKQKLLAGHRAYIANIRTRKKAAKEFRDRIAASGMSPAGYLLDILEGKAQYIPEFVDIAKHLTQFELPKLQAIEGAVRVGPMTHEEALDQLDE